jgi:hypothetical protein
MLKTLTLLTFVLAAAQAELLVVEKHDNPPHVFSRIGPSPADKVLTLRLALAHNDITTRLSMMSARQEIRTMDNISQRRGKFDFILVSSLLDRVLGREIRGAFAGYSYTSAVVACVE